MTNYKLIQEAIERATTNRDMTILYPEDVTGKVEYEGEREEYFNNFSDYHKKD